MSVCRKAQSAIAVLLIATITLVSGCATSPKMAPVHVGDNNLTKEQIVCELEKLNAAQQKIDSNKGLTGTNVAAALFWLPGLAYTYYDAGEATRLIEQRRAHLTTLYNQKTAQQEPKTRNRKA